MGVEGGVCWFRATDKEEFERLVEPLGFLTWYKHHNDVNYPWLDENKREDCVYSTWETYQDVSLYTLKDIINALELLHDLDSPHWYDCWQYQCLFDLTFAEIIEDWKTFPEYDKGMIGTHLRDFLEWNAMDDFYSNERKPRNLEHPVLQMKSLDWCKAVRKVMVWDSFGYVETWT